jgi:hypothetical protein
LLWLHGTSDRRCVDKKNRLVSKVPEAITKVRPDIVI